jgi:hypothetical protein
MASPSPQQPTVLLWRCVIIDDDVPVHAADDAAALADLLAHTMDKDPYFPVDAFTKVYRETVVRRSTLGGARQTHLYTECIELWRSWEHPEDVCDGFGKKHTRSDGMVVYWSYHTWSERERQVDSMRFKIQCDNVQKFKRSTSVVLPPSAPPLQVKPTSTPFGHGVDRSPRTRVAHPRVGEVLVWRNGCTERDARPVGERV